MFRHLEQAVLSMSDAEKPLEHRGTRLAAAAKARRAVPQSES